MTPEQFIAWLRGIIEMHDAAQVGQKVPRLLMFNVAQVDLIRKRLNEVEAQRIARATEACATIPTPLERSSESNPVASSESS